MCTILSLKKKPPGAKKTCPMLLINSLCLSSDPFHVERSKKPPLCTGCLVRNGVGITDECKN
jgi:hypothetical protein